MTTKDFTVGEKLYIRKYNRYPEPHFDVSVGIVEKIGRKYINVKLKFSNHKFEIDPRYDSRLICSDRGYDKYTAYKNETAAKEYDEWKELKSWFYKLTTSSTNLSLDQLQRIKEIVEE